ncbi:hypothetical protein NEOKW01_1647 [Nematocida sp. AWRm80]|nr:hypothetical protein NEOKW01_1647 [Nematocida sp. AWRm80]
MNGTLNILYLDYFLYFYILNLINNKNNNYTLNYINTLINNDDYTTYNSTLIKYLIFSIFSINLKNKKRILKYINNNKNKLIINKIILFLINSDKSKNEYYKYINMNEEEYKREYENAVNSKEKSKDYSLPEDIRVLVIDEIRVIMREIEVPLLVQIVNKTYINKNTTKETQSEKVPEKDIKKDNTSESWYPEELERFKVEEFEKFKLEILKGNKEENEYRLEGPFKEEISLIKDSNEQIPNRQIDSKNTKDKYTDKQAKKDTNPSSNHSEEQPKRIKREKETEIPIREEIHTTKNSLSEEAPESNLNAVLDSSTIISNNSIDNNRDNSMLQEVSGIFNLENTPIQTQNTHRKPTHLNEPIRSTKIFENTTTGKEVRWEDDIEIKHTKLKPRIIHPEGSEECSGRIARDKKRKFWSTREELLLIEGYQTYGNDWNKVQDHGGFKHLTILQLKEKLKSLRKSKKYPEIQ